MIVVYGLNVFVFIGQSPILDSRCYLEGGGSAESFLASEDMAVGSIIGNYITPLLSIKRVLTHFIY